MEEQKEENKKAQEELEEDSFKKCIKCGRKIPENTRFCSICGRAQTKDAFPLLVIGCLVTILAVSLTWIWASPYSLTVNILVPVLVLVILALILSFTLWR